MNNWKVNPKALPGIKELITKSIASELEKKFVQNI